ncbi:MAG: radical SAM protein [Pseudomonadota bacterium]
MYNCHTKKQINDSDNTCQKELKLDPERLERVSNEFFSRFGNIKLLGEPFFNALGLSSNPAPKNIFEILLCKCGYPDNATGFFEALLSLMNNGPSKQTTLGGIQIPVLYLYELLSIVLPGKALHQIKSIDQLKKKTRVKPEDQEKLQKVINQYPVRLSDHVIRQAMVSEGVARQYLPFVQELDDTGHDITFDGHFKTGLLEQMYQNRVVFLLDMQCPVYCRFCFRKHKSNRKEKTPTIKDVARAVDHVKSHPAIKEILITGGEPLLNKANLEAAIDGLIRIDHVQTIRIATRSIAYYPDLFLNSNQAYIHYLIHKNKACLARGKRIEMGIHLVHPDEISIQSLDIISLLVKNGIPVYLQTPFLKGVNTEGQTLARLFMLLRQAGAQIYYIFTPCSPIHGTNVYWTPISLAFKAARYLRQHLSDRCIPKLCTATPLGKIEWHTSGWAVETDPEDQTYTWIRTPYTRQYFEQFLSGAGSGPAVIAQRLPNFRVNKEGTLDARFKVDMGKKHLLVGKRPEDTLNSEIMALEDQIQRARDAWSCLKDQTLIRSAIQESSSRHVIRFHAASVELDMGAGPADFEYIENNTCITDVVLCCQQDDKDAFEKIGRIVNRLKCIHHIVCARLCIKQLTVNPGLLTDTRIEAMASWADFSIENPFKIEIETWVLLPGQMDKDLGSVAQKLISKGISIYTNVPLIKGVNDQPKTIVQIAHTLRQARIQFHHVYVAGLNLQARLQKQFNTLPISTKTMIDIASKVRTDCSGREIPLYIVQTPQGETDYNIFIPEE